MAVLSCTALYVRHHPKHENQYNGSAGLLHRLRWSWRWGRPWLRRRRWVWTWRGVGAWRRIGRACCLAVGLRRETAAAISGCRASAVKAIERFPTACVSALLVLTCIIIMRHRMCERQHTLAEVACYRTGRTLMGCAKEGIDGVRRRGR